MQADRYHGLDALRATMMLLGLVFHCAPFYMANPLLGFGDKQNNQAFDLLFHFIHFRMPVFFLLAGFFGALLYFRHGPGAFIRNRVNRVVLPMIVFWPLVVPPGAAAVRFTTAQYGTPLPLFSLVPGEPWWRQPVLGILWFLWYLTIFYAAAVVARPVVHKLPAPMKAASAKAFRRVAGSVWAPVVMTAVAIMAAAPAQNWKVGQLAAAVPPPGQLLYYLTFFSFGWHLFRERDLLASFEARWPLWCTAGASGAFAYAWLTVNRSAAAGYGATLVSGALLALATWMLAVGGIGFFHRYLNRRYPVVRYFADASYWMYLMHPVPAFLTPGLLAHTTWPAGVKFSLVLGVTIISTVVTYHYFVRSTVIGQFLNGRRFTNGAAPSPANEEQIAIS